MAANTSGLSWFDFLFTDKTDLLEKHLSDPSADPSASQLIVQFLERSGISEPQQQTSDVAPSVDNKRGKRLKELALQVGFHLKWNLEAFEESLSLHWQNLFFNELLKLQTPSYQNLKNGLVSLKELDEKSAMALIIYCRWVIRTLAQHFLPNIAKPKTNMMETAENENILKNLKEQLSTCISVLEDTLSLAKDLELPCPLDQNTVAKDPDIVNKNDNPDGKDNGLKKERLNEVETVQIADIKAQVSFDLGTLYFYEEKFEKAAKLFQHCKEAKCSRSSCYTVQEDMLHGYYMSCCGLLDSMTDAMFKTEERESKATLLEKVQHYKLSSFEDLMEILITDNIKQELPMDYRKWLERDVEDTKHPINMQWEIEACNIIRLVLEGHLSDSAFWSDLKTCTEDHLECILSLCVLTLQKDSKQSLDKNSRFQILRSFVCLLCSCFENGFKVAQNSEARIFLGDLKANNDQYKKKRVEANPMKYSPCNIFPDFRSDYKDLKCTYLLQNLWLSFDPQEINSIVDELHRMQPSRRFHLENLTCMTYKVYLDDIQDPVLQDILHIIFSKALQCGSKKEYELSRALLQYAIGRLGTSNAPESAIERVKVAVNQELLVIDLKKNKSKKDGLVNQVKSYIHESSNQLDLSPDVEKVAVAYLLNSKELTFLSNLKMDKEVFATDYRTLGSLLAAACLSVMKPQQWRKSIHQLWDGVLRIFTSTVQHKRPQDGRSAILIRREVNSMSLSSFVDFVDQVQEETCLAVIISCLVRLHNLSKEGQGNTSEIFSSYGYLWPTSVTNRSSVNFAHIDHAMLHITKYAVTVYPYNAVWLQTLGDIYLDSNNFSSSLKCYLEAGACSSSLFSSSIPLTVWDTQIFKKMVECCMELKAYIQAALLCQCLDPKDYATAFKAIQLAATAAGEDAMDQYYMMFWDVTMLEYLINTHFQQGQHEKKLLVIQTINQPELNIFNSQDILDHAEGIRKASLFRALAKQYL